MTGPSSLRELPPPRSRASIWLAGCASTLALLALGFGAATIRASASLDRRVVRLRAELAAVQSSLAVERMPILGPPLPGNAVDNYQVMDWVLGPPVRMTVPPRGADATGLRRDHAHTAGPDPWSCFTRSWWTLEKELDAHEAPTDAQARALAEYRPLTQLARRAVRRERCEWGFRLDETVGVPFIVTAQEIAVLLAYEAQDEPPDEAARTGLVIVALGRDLAQQQGLLETLLGRSIEHTGAHRGARDASRRALARGVRAHRRRARAPPAHRARPRAPQ